MPPFPDNSGDSTSFDIDTIVDRSMVEEGKGATSVWLDRAGLPEALRSPGSLSLCCLFP